MRRVDESPVSVDFCPLAVSPCRVLMNFFFDFFFNFVYAVPLSPASD